ncbi:MAG: epoxyqueuosine reductase QueH [Desulfonatronovibrio sp.]
MSARILLHMCCGPCAVYPISILREKGFEVMGLFFNPNIHPLKEYQRRADSAIKAGENLGIRVVALHREYNPEKFLRSMVFREEQRCVLCYQMRLERTRNMALKGGFDFFTSTLLFSKRQKHAAIKSTGESLDGSKCGFLYEDFRAGWALGRQMAMDMALYRQNYCGCIYSEFERFKNELQNDDNQGQVSRG